MHLRSRGRSWAAGFAVLASLLVGSVGDARAQDEPYRPQFHFTPAANWMNDPNGLVYLDGEYHLFFQHNPFGPQWGNMSWGHAVSTDLVQWKQLPVALPADADEAVFSGSAVVDHENTSGLGTREHPPMVAIYTSARPGRQVQSLAYSTDRGRTWTKYAGNPVLDIGSNEFRDPKVFWYAPERKWIIAVALAADRKIAFYSSPDLIAWEKLSEFGPANAVGGAWECPDLFPLPVDGDPERRKWVLMVSLNPGSIAGGSGTQYFVGDFDGRRFTADDAGAYTPPAGDLIAGFDGAGYDGWSATGTAFGDGPAGGTLPGQQAVAGFEGAGLVNSFRDGDATTGTLTSPPFTLARDHVNLLVGGGAHRRAPGTGDGVPPGGAVVADFDDTGWPSGWTAIGALADAAPAPGALPGQLPVTGYDGTRLVNTFVGGDAGTGRLTSPPFELTADHVNLLVGGGPHESTAVTLVVDGEVVRRASGAESEQLNWVSWDVSALRGRTARIEVVDEHTGGWGHVLVDRIMLADRPALPRSTETAVNLVVDGEVVRTAAGEESERLDWVSWDVAALRGREARIEIVDRNTGGWGHILADQIMLADTPARPAVQRSAWLDHGRDNYAGVTWNDAPGGHRLMIGWMNNWQYAGAIPTAPWRGAMTVVRELGLKTIDGRPRLVQTPVPQQRDTAAKLRAPRRAAADGELVTRGRALEIEAVLRPGMAGAVGLRVLTGDVDETVVGYDATAGEVFLDRTRSGATAFSPLFASRERAPLRPRGGKVRLKILVDRSSVEVFADRGQVAITDQVFPSASSDGVEVYVEGGTGWVESLRVWPLRSSVRAPARPAAAAPPRDARTCGPRPCRRSASRR